MNFREVEKFLKTAKPESEQVPLILENNICRDLKLFRDNMHHKDLTFRERVALIDRYHKIVDDLDRIDIDSSCVDVHKSISIRFNLMQ